METATEFFSPLVAEVASAFDDLIQKECEVLLSWELMNETTHALRALPVEERREAGLELTSIALGLRSHARTTEGTLFQMSHLIGVVMECEPEARAWLAERVEKDPRAAKFLGGDSKTAAPGKDEMRGKDLEGPAGLRVTRPPRRA